MSVWDDVKLQIDIESVVGQYISLTPNGANFKARCPFHSEKNPSFIVSKSKQIWHCFGCGLGGDVFGFVSQIENITKFEALELLAKQAGIEVIKPQKQTKISINLNDNNGNDSSSKIELSEYEYGLKMLDWAAKLFHNLLQKEINKPKSILKNYLIERQIDQNLIQTFKLGFAPEQDLLVELSRTKKGLNLEMMEKTGLIIPKNSDKQKLFKDKFKGRLVIPISNDKGQVVGFTGRLLENDANRPKYLNSAQTNWFNKSNLLFGLDLARKNIYQKKEIILVEGHLDLISAYNKGLNNVVASGGTSITTDHLQKIGRLTKNLTLALDNDSAGFLASRKVFIQATSMGLNVNQLQIPLKYKDIDEYFKDEDSNKPDLITVSFLDYYLNSEITNLTSRESKAQKDAILDYLELLSVVDSITSEQYLDKLSQITRISTSSLKSSLNNLTSLQNKSAASFSNTDFNENKNKTDETLLRTQNDLKILLSLYISLVDKEYYETLKEFVASSWEIMKQLNLLPGDLNTTLEDAISILNSELKFIWEVDLHKKVIARSDYIMEIVKYVNNYILPHRNILQLDENFMDLLFQYDQKYNELLGKFR